MRAHDDDELDELLEMLGKLLDAADAGDYAEAQRGELAALLKRYEQTNEAPTDEELRRVFARQFPLGLTARLVSADGLERDIPVSSPPPPVFRTALAPLLDAASMEATALPSTSPPVGKTREYELIRFDIRHGVAVYREKLR